jgi:hypothetical protein
MADTDPDGTPLPMFVRCGEPIQPDEPICQRGWIWADTAVRTAQWQMGERPDCVNAPGVFDFRRMLAPDTEPGSWDW